MLSFGENVTFARIQRSDAGKYHCVAENGIGEAAMSRISTVDVQCKKLAFVSRYKLSLLIIVRFF